jgi:hypothetical protein
LFSVGDIEAGLPGFQVPWKFHMANHTSDATTDDPIEIVKKLDIGLAMLPLVSMIQHIAIVKFYARKSVASQAPGESQEILFHCDISIKF